MTTARQRRGNSNAETESSGNGPFIGHETKYFADGRCTSWQHGHRTLLAVPSSSRGYCEGIRVVQMQLVDTETTVEAVE